MSIAGSVPELENELISWVRKRAEESNYSLSSNAARVLVNRVGARPGILAKELEKNSHLCRS
jgi:DNA polymerase III delta subunit